MRAAARRQPLEYNLLLTVTLCLMAGGAVMVYSASSARIVLQAGGDGTGYLVKYVMYGAIGFAVMQVLARRGPGPLARLTGPLLGISFVLVLATKLPGIGVSVNGARRWLGAGPLQFQPSELLKVALVLYAVKLLAERPKIVRSPRLLVPLAFVVVCACGLVAMQPDLGTALVIAFTMATILVAAGVPIRYILVAFLAGAFVVLLYSVTSPYRMARLTSFIDPWKHAGTSGFQAVQGQIAVGSGGLFGQGLGAGGAKNFYLPEAHTDFILAIIGEELGIAGIFGLCFLYGVLAYAGLRVAKNARGTYLQLLAAGLTSLIVCQAALNMFAVLGIAPLTGVPLPFISYGSTNLIVLLGAVGVLLFIADGGTVHLRAVDSGRSGKVRDRDERPHRSGRNSGARGARAGGRRRAAG